MLPVYLSLEKPLDGHFGNSTVPFTGPLSWMFQAQEFHYSQSMINQLNLSSESSVITAGIVSIFITLPSSGCGKIEQGCKTWLFCNAFVQVG